MILTKWFQSQKNLESTLWLPWIVTAHFSTIKLRTAIKKSVKYCLTQKFSHLFDHWAHFNFFTEYFSLQQNGSPREQSCFLNYVDFVGIWGMNHYLKQMEIYRVGYLHNSGAIWHRSHFSFFIFNPHPRMYFLILESEKEREIPMQERNIDWLTLPHTPT